MSDKSYADEFNDPDWDIILPAAGVSGALAAYWLQAARVRDPYMWALLQAGLAGSIAGMNVPKRGRGGAVSMFTLSAIFGGIAHYLSPYTERGNGRPIGIAGVGVQNGMLLLSAFA